MKDVFGQALLDYYHNRFEPPLLLHNEYGPPEVIPVERYFLDEQDYSDLEIFALRQVKGKILDVGAATGRHARFLQMHDYDVEAMDISQGCGSIMKEAGIKKVIIDNIYQFNKKKYDTILMLMNGIGISGTIDGLIKLLLHLKTILHLKGLLLFDTTNISYLFTDGQFPETKYFGELTFRYEYKNMVDEPFNWLYIDQDKLVEVANTTGWNCQIVYEDETSAYLARLQPI